MKQFDFPLVSIIMPAYNAEEYLEIAIKSVIDQTYKNWELMIAVRIQPQIYVMSGKKKIAE